jgi:hypothetical protein
LYDDSSGRESDDWAVITTRRPVDEYCVNSFEQSYTDDDVEVAYHERDNLDGKVSRAEIEIIGVIVQA